MIYSLFPVKDCSIYEEYYNRQTGLDEILSVGKETIGNYRIRSLIAFDLPFISRSLSDGLFSQDTSFHLQLYLATGSKVFRDQEILVHPVTQDWTEGGGYYFQDIFQIADGATWNVRSSGSYWSTSGSSFNASISSSTIMQVPVSDVSIDVTNLVHTYVSGSTYDGFLLKFPTSDEANPINKGELRFFSRNTHTIYRPVLQARWNSQVYNTGSFSSSNASGNSVVIPNNAQPKYYQNERVRINISVRDQIPLKTFSTVFSNYNGKQYLPRDSFFCIIDDQSRTTILPYSEGTRVQCDSEGPYIEFYTQQMFPSRYYRIVFRVDRPTGSRFYESNITFSIA